MLGAICGDIIGSPYEFGGMKDYDFDLFVDKNHLTDDSFMTAAVAEAIMSCDDLDVLDKECVRAYRKFFKLHPDVGYGGMFKKWADSDTTRYLMSWGNGAAMRVTPVGWLFNCEEDVVAAATKTALPTHGSPESIRGARAIALCVFLTRKGYSKEELKEKIETDYYYDLNEPISSIREWYKFEVSCQASVPVAIRAYLDSVDFEDAIRLAVSVGGDSDTIGAMTGSIAEAAYGIPNSIESKVLSMLSDDVMDTYRTFCRVIGRSNVLYSSTNT